MLDNEASTTPVQDKHFTTFQNQNPPPNNENPIEFLCRLMATQKVPQFKWETDVMV